MRNAERGNAGLFEMVGKVETAAWAPGRTYLVQRQRAKPAGSIRDPPAVPNPSDRSLPCSPPSMSFNSSQIGEEILSATSSLPFFPLSRHKGVPCVQPESGRCT